MFSLRIYTHSRKWLGDRARNHSNPDRNCHPINGGISRDIDKNRSCFFLLSPAVAGQMIASLRGFVPRLRLS
jgi:hypothetical protein